MLKFRLRRSGRFKATVQVAHYIGGVEIVKMICRFSSSGFIVVDKGQALSRAQVEKLTRDVVQSYGMCAYLSEDDWSIDVPSDEIATRLRWVVAEVTRMWPELADSELETYVKDLAETHGFDVEETD